MRTAIFVMGLSVALWNVGVATASDTSGGKKAPSCGVKACKAMGKPCKMKAEFAKKGWIQLFNGENLDGWTTRPDRKGKNCWTAKNGELINALKPGVHGIDLITKKKFTNFMMHVEFKVPRRGNSGVYLRGRIEVQVHDSSRDKKPAMHTCGSLYSKKVADKLVAKKVGEWQCFNITLKGKTVTVVHNGEKIIDKFDCPAPTGGQLDGKNYGKAGPIMLQGDHTGVTYRNIWIKPID